MCVCMSACARVCVNVREGVRMRRPICMRVHERLFMYKYGLQHIQTHKNKGVCNVNAHNLARKIKYGFEYIKYIYVCDSKCECQ